MNAQQKFQRAIDFYNANKLDRAEALLREVHSIAALRSDASYGLGLVAFKRTRSDEAYGWFSMVERQSAHFADSRYYMGVIEKHRGTIPAAVRACSEALAKDRTHQWALELARELRSYTHSTGVAATELGPAAPLPLTMRRPAGQQVETDLWLPMEDELDDYAERKLAKERIDYRVDSWLKYPAWQRAFYLVFITSILVAMLVTFAKLARTI